jgi:SHS2 domain-containing protein
MGGNGVVATDRMTGSAVVPASYRYFEHTADVGIEARGATLAEAFTQAGLALANLLVDTDTVRPIEWRDVTVEGDDLADLLVAWLNELIFLFDLEGFLTAQFSFSRIGPKDLEARLWGETFDPQRHALRTGVKAATYHQVAVEVGDDVVVRAIIDV